MVMISISGLTKKYGQHIVLNDINISFEKGSIYGIVGKNGAGKTTLFRCVSGLETYEGTIAGEQSNLKSKLGLLLTESYFLPKITGEEYIYLLAEARGIQIENLSERNLFNLPLTQYVDSYSTGMKKKLSIIGVLLQQNDYFIFDEPFNGLDLESSFILTEILKRLKAKNKTILISSHIFSTLKDVCDRILVLNNGVFQQDINKSSFDILENDLKNEVIMQDIDRLFL